MYNLKNKSLLVLLVGIVSYLYLFSSLLNKNYNIIFIYFTILFTGYFIIGNNIFLYNFLKIINDILNNKFIIREGNYDKKFEAGKEKAKKNDKFNKDGGSIKLDDISGDDGEELIDKMDEKDQDNEKKKEAGQINLKDAESENDVKKNIKLLEKNLRI